MSVFVQQTAQIAAPHAQSSLAPHWIMHLGALGLFFVAVIDSSVIPLPLPGSTDLLLLWLVAHSGDPWLLAPCAVAGSILGGYTTWHIGRRGGEDALRHYVPARLLGPIVGWVERHPVLAFPPCFHRRFHCCRLRSHPARWAFLADASWQYSVRLAACVTPSSHGSA